ncbi:hypothetical protein [Sphingomonas sp. LHG3406-1]|nr:hypothetical protein [Sphingomonas sp. LHG3406-1]
MFATIKGVHPDFTRTSPHPTVRVKKKPQKTAWFSEAYDGGRGKD